MAHESCLNKIRSALEKHHGTKVELQLVPWISFEDGEGGTDMAPLYYTYTEGKKRKRGNLHLPFCPFCGKRNGENTPTRKDKRTND